MSELPYNEDTEDTGKTDSVALLDPVRYIPGDETKRPSDRMALCLSGGGYRAMLFHAGALWRINDLGILTEIKRISSVSGGSITAGVLAMNWNKLDFRSGVAANFEEAVITPLRNMGSRTVDIPSVIAGILSFGNIGSKVAKRYRKYLFGDTTLQDLPDDPRFVINATNVQSGVLCRFSKPYMWDYRVGKIETPSIELATAVAASSAFPPVLSPMILKFNPKSFTPKSGKDLENEEYQRRMVLTDGGVYDNLGLETAWKRYNTILVSDAGGGFAAEPKPKLDWLRHTARTLFTIDNQVRSLRRRQVVGAFKASPPLKTGAFWSIASDFSDGFGVNSPLDCPFERTLSLAKLATRLSKLDADTQMRLINWGYAATDFSIRKFLRRKASPPADFPYAGIGV